MSRSTLSGITIRPFHVDDERRVLELLSVALGSGPIGWRGPEFFRWKHFQNPFGESLLLVAEAQERIVGLRAFMRWEFQAGNRRVRAVRAVDTATHPEFRGRGLFTRMTMEALEILRSNTDLVFNTPNAKSGPGYLKMGWRQVTSVRVLIRPRRPVRLIRRFLAREPDTSRSPILVDAPSAADVLETSELGGLLQRSEVERIRLSTPYSKEFLDWRYGSRSGLDYRMVTEVQDAQLRGAAVFRVRSRSGLWQASISELFVGADDVQGAGRLLRRVWQTTLADYVAVYFPSGSTAARAAARRRGFLRSPRGIRFVVNPLTPDLRPDPVDPASWALGLGDLEVF